MTLTQKEKDNLFLEFLKYWKTEASKPTCSVPFSIKVQGLCCVFQTFLRVRYNICVNEFNAYAFIDAITGVKDYPFNVDGACYNSDSSREAMHLNPKRVAFVDEQIKRLES